MKTNRKSNQKTELESRPEQSRTAGRPLIDLQRRLINRSLETEQLLEMLRTEFPQFYDLAETVGKWVWVTFPARQSVAVTSVLSQLGFHWSNLRQSWQHPRGTLSAERCPIDPRKRYGSASPLTRRPYDH
jgi:hypothetical protein